MGELLLSHHDRPYTEIQTVPTKFGRAFVARLQSAGLIIVTHQPSLVRQHCSRAAVLDQGTLTFYEDIDEALATYNSL